MVVKKRGKGKSGLMAFLAALLLTAGVLCAQRMPVHRLAAAQPGTSAEAITSGVSLYSPNAILMRLNGSSVPVEENADQRIYPASLTKIMTVLVAIEQSDNLKKQIVMQKDWYDELVAADASMAGFLPGEQIAVKDLLYGAILCSGAECCVALATDVAESQTAFVALMNQKARQLGMNNTHFTNVTGLHQDDHYSTVRDLALMLQNALKNKTFRQIFTSKRYSISSTNRHPQGMTITSSLFSKLSSSSVQGGQILGGKTGYTQQAGLCLATLAVQNGSESILITAGAPGDHKTEQFHIMDALNIYNAYPIL